MMWAALHRDTGMLHVGEGGFRRPGEDGTRSCEPFSRTETEKRNFRTPPLFCLPLGFLVVFGGVLVLYAGALSLLLVRRKPSTWPRNASPRYTKLSAVAIVAGRCSNPLTYDAPRSSLGVGMTQGISRSAVSCSRFRLLPPVPPCPPPPTRTGRPANGHVRCFPRRHRAHSCAHDEHRLEVRPQLVRPHPPGHRLRRRPWPPARHRRGRGLPRASPRDGPRRPRVLVHRDMRIADSGTVGRGRCDDTDDDCVHVESGSPCVEIGRVFGDAWALWCPYICVCVSPGVGLDSPSFPERGIPTLVVTARLWLTGAVVLA